MVEQVKAESLEELEEGDNSALPAPEDDDGGTVEMAKVGAGRDRMPGSDDEA